MDKTIWKSGDFSNRRMALGHKPQILVTLCNHERLKPSNFNMFPSLAQSCLKTYIHTLPGTVVGQGRYVLAEKLCEVYRLPESTSLPQHLALPLPSQRWGGWKVWSIHHTSSISCYVFVVCLCGLAERRGPRENLMDFLGQVVNALDSTRSVAAKSAIEEPLQGISININYWYFSWILHDFTLLFFLSLNLSTMCLGFKLAQAAAWRWSMAGASDTLWGWDGTLGWVVCRFGFKLQIIQPVFCGVRKLP